ncbi:glycosyltransferase family 4 protein [Candidatus Pacearchaeota archaeon]|nr:glycosyltransferase family 4 protein [Candidatus Pacearchaeota archaeon]
MHKPKIAIFHNFLDNIGGAEIVTLILAQELHADIYTTNVDRKKIKKMGFNPKKIYTLGQIPINAPFRQQFALEKFKRLNLKSKYDFYIIAGDWAMAGAINNKPNLWYVHSPIREIWDLHRYTRQHSVPSLLRPIFDLWVLYNRYLNKKYVHHVQSLVCNSKNTQKRVKKYLNKDSIVINPPIETNKYKFNKTGDYWLSVSRLITHKRIDLQLKAFSKMKDEKLIIVGSYEDSRHFQKYAKYCHEIKPKNVTIVSWIDHQELIDLYSNCKGFIITSKDEDFGMTPIEAMASGKPVIAPNEGGYMETVINNKTGILIDNINTQKLIDSVKKINKDLEKNPLKYKNACQKRAKEFDTKEFIKKIKKEINK